MSNYNLIIKILTCVAVFLSLTCIVGLIVLAVLPTPSVPSDDGGQVPSAPVVNNTVTLENVTLPQSADAGEAYLEKIFFVGDSTTLHFNKADIDPSHILVPNSLTLMLSSDILTVLVTDAQVSIPAALKNANAEIVIITVGVNGADGFSELSYKTYYKKLINAIRQESPDTKIILQSVFPVEYSFSEKDNGISNESINKLNEWAKQIAVDCSARYLDTQSILKGEDGAMLPKYSEGDGVHMNAAAYEKIVEYIRTHAID